MRLVSHSVSVCIVVQIIQLFTFPLSFLFSPHPPPSSIVSFIFPSSSHSLLLPPPPPSSLLPPTSSFFLLLPPPSDFFLPPLSFFLHFSSFLPPSFPSPRQCWRNCWWSYWRVYFSFTPRPHHSISRVPHTTQQ